MVLTATPKDAKEFIEKHSANIFMKVTLNTAIPLLLISFVYFTYLNMYTSIIYTIVSYFMESLLFIAGHVHTHQQYMEVRDGKVEKLTAINYLGFLHHYADPTIFYKMDFTSYIFAYLVTNFPIQKNYIFRNMSMYSNSITFMEGISLVLSLVTSFWYFNYPPLLILLGFLWSYYFMLYRFSQVMQLMMMSYFFEFRHLAYIWIYAPMMLLLNAMLHLWYHTPQRHRKSHFYYSYPFFQGLEMVSIISTDRHKKHHKHRLENVDETVIWTDLPQFVFEDYLESLCTNIFRSKSVGGIKITFFYVFVNVISLLIVEMLV